jgi:hypothetical protein
MPSEEVKRKQVAYMSEAKRFITELYPELRRKLQSIFQSLPLDEAAQLLSAALDLDVKRQISENSLLEEQAAARSDAEWSALFDRALAATEQLNDGIRTVIAQIDLLIDKHTKD